MTRAVTFEALLSRWGQVQVRWPGPGEPEVLRAHPRLSVGADAVVSQADEGAAKESAAAVRPGGTVALVAIRRGWLGRLFPDDDPGPALAEALLGAGLRELGAAVVPGAMRTLVVVWGTRPS